ncbi:hypothetical protein UFOVP1575_24 [uncultured Caudovirales phage]|uniref:Uncharacterized protein n=1 Tax=uncultured Caudovirales phage TaxID=2100421 RepID=A0A6J5QY36_9CAUD|nr:hypothetical protein UFOVP1128_19 [uncultured Caudovirales phage]CAB4192346.1 hypothetical protein UFOVP1237_27 [uncultured Caudovirales phage]CAB4216340.1 hypothetical protein UFOVP1489_35 [uncultured Caudovirales phage]CAB5230458.1 hypothetical protein UFOVP1575_24 [uncultured Caudovirales phage]
MIQELEKGLTKIVLGSHGAELQLREVYSQAKATAAKLRELIGLIEESIIEHIDTTGEDIELEDGKRWYVGTERKTKAIDDSSVLLAIVQASQGDISKLTTGKDGVLAANPWKNAAVRSLIGEDKFCELFKTTTTACLETGKAVRILKTADPSNAIGMMHFKGGL